MFLSTTRIDCPDDFKPFKQSQISFLIKGASPSVASSKINRRGLSSMPALLQAFAVLLRIADSHII